MKLKIITKIAAICSIPILLIAAIFCLAQQTATATSAELLFQVHPQYDLVYVTGWDEGVPVTLTVTNEGGDILTVITTTSEILPWDPPVTGADFSSTGFDFQHGQVLTAEGELLTKAFHVPNPVVTEIDLSSDTISGTGTPGDRMLVCANPNFFRWTTIDPDGNWMVDFTTPSDPYDSPGSRDLMAGSNGWADEFSTEGDQTWADDWHVPNPRFAVRANTDQVRGWEWTSGETLNLYVDGQVITGTVLDPSYIDFNLGDIYDIQAGDVISLTNSVITKTTTVTGLAINGVDVDEDTVSGMAAPGSNVDICVCYTTDWINTYRHVTADMGGNWVADFSVFGDDPDEQNTFDILPGTWVDSVQVDEDSDATMYGMTVPKPSIYAHLNENRVDIVEFPVEDSVDMMIKGTDVYTTMTGVTDLNGYANFDLGWSFTLEPGQIITVTNNIVTKTLTVMDLYVDLFDPKANMVSGHSDPDAELAVNVWTDNGNQSVQADATGSWTASYDTSAGPWFPTTHGEVTSWDTDGDATVYIFNTGNIFAWIPSTVELQNPNNYRTYTLTIDDPSNGPGVDYTDTQPVEKPGEQTNVTFNLVGFEIKAGDLITITAGHDIRSLVIAPKGEISFDVEHDIISGVNQPDSWVSNVDAISWRDAKTDATGAWSIDYSMPGPNGQPVEDIAYGLSGALFQLDADGDFTPFGWRILANIYLPSINR